MNNRIKIILYAVLLAILIITAVFVLTFMYSSVISLDDTVLSTLVLEDFSDEYLLSDSGKKVEIVAPNLFQYDLFRNQVKSGDRVFYRTYKLENTDEFALSISVNNRTYLSLQDIIDHQAHKNEIAISIFTVSLILIILVAVRLVFIVLKRYKNKPLKV